MTTPIVYTHRTKPQYIAAYQFINLREWDRAQWGDGMPAWLLEAITAGVIVTQGSQLLLMTHRGQVTVKPTDWIILHHDGRMVASDNATFAVLYEAWQRPLPLADLEPIDPKARE